MLSEHVKILTADKANPPPVAATFASILAGQTAESKQQQHQLLNLVASDNKDRNERHRRLKVSNTSSTSNTSRLLVSFNSQVITKQHTSKV